MLLCPFHREQHRTAPFPADPNALDQTDKCQQNGAPDTDAGIARHESHGNGREACYQQGGDQRRLAADAVPEVAEYRRPDWPPDKPDEEHAKRLEDAINWKFHRTRRAHLMDEADGRSRVDPSASPTGAKYRAAKYRPVWTTRVCRRGANRVVSCSAY